MNEIDFELWNKYQLSYITLKAVPDAWFFFFMGGSLQLDAGHDVAPALKNLLGGGGGGGGLFFFLPQKKLSVFQTQGN